MSSIKVNMDLIRKYNIPGPRYTSYPTAIQFEERFNPEEHHQYLEERNSTPREISLYVHVPFCFSLCWYCGCTKIITRDASRGTLYIDYLEKEMDLLKSIIHPESKVVQLHFGGGTPTFLKPDELRRLGEAIHNRFTFDDHAEISIEIDPRRLTKEHITALQEVGFNRASIGVQDTNSEVQQAIHRIQPFEMTRNATAWLREAGFKSVNFDLIYGLPRQNLESFIKTLSDISTLNPDRLAVYSYAHVPWIKPSQKLLNEDEFPSTDEKLSMLKTAIEFLTKSGYTYIGMDHFSVADDELTHALENGTLQRNFQGYSTHGGTDLYALGMSGISQVDGLYYQNTKNMDLYYGSLDEQKWAVEKTCWLSKDDKIRRDVIMQIMCKSELSYRRISEKWDIDAATYFAPEIQALDSLEQDDLVKRTDDGIKILDQGRLFIRNIAMQFDRYLQEKRTGKTFSKTI